MRLLTYPSPYILQIRKLRQFSNKILTFNASITALSSSDTGKNPERPMYNEMYKLLGKTNSLIIYYSDFRFHHVVKKQERNKTKETLPVEYVLIF